MCDTEMSENSVLWKGKELSVPTRVFLFHKSTIAHKTSATMLLVMYLRGRNFLTDENIAAWHGKFVHESESCERCVFARVVCQKLCKIVVHSDHRGILNAHRPTGTLRIF